MGTPALLWNSGRVVVGEIVVGHTDEESLGLVAEVLVFERIAVVLRVTHNVDLAAVVGHAQVWASHWRICEEAEVGTGVDVGAEGASMARVGRAEDIVEAADEGDGEVEDTMAEDTEHLLGEGVFGDSVMMVEASLCAPADMESAGDILARPIHDLAQLLPIVDLLEGHLLDGRACDNHSVVLAAADLVESEIEGAEMLGGGVAGSVGLDHHEIHRGLERRIGESPEELGLGGHLVGHEIENQDSECTDILRHCTALAHYEHALALESLLGWECVWNAYWHGFSFLKRLEVGRKKMVGHKITKKRRST